MNKFYILVFPAIILMSISTNSYSQKIFSCESKYEADFKVFVVDSKYDADLVVFKVDSKSIFPIF